jgi:serine/threonine protein kinase
VSGNRTNAWRGEQQLPPQIPDLELLRPIGSGRFGQVWLAANRTTGLLRAAKLIPLHPPDDAPLADREIGALMLLEKNLRTRHPDLLTTYHVGRTDRYLFYTMDPADDVSGKAASSDPSYQPATLKERLQASPFSTADCVRHSRQLLAGLACLHQAGMVHRDVKPANCVFVGGELKLADFGLVTEQSTQVSRVGTPKYMRPNGPIDAGNDSYAAGLVIYEMLTGLPTESFPRLGERARDVARSPELRALNRTILRACERDAKRGFADASEMLAQLTMDSSERLRHPMRVRRLVLVIIAVLAALIVSAVVRFWPNRAPTVDVSFISQPFGATIYLDGKALLQADGTPYTTPCTVPGVSAKTHHVSFKREGAADLDVGEIDLVKNREVTARWGAE